MTGTKGTILVVDDNPFNREGLVLYLENEGFATCQAGDAEVAMAAARSTRPSGAIVDIVIPRRPGDMAALGESVGLELTRQLKGLDPSLGVVVFSAYDDRGREVWGFVRDGMRGLAYMLKGSRPEHVIDALEQALAGNVYLDPKALTNTRHLEDELLQQLSAAERPWVEQAVRLFPTLSEREQQVALQLANSQNLVGIAGSLGIAVGTVENHVTSVYNKLLLANADSVSPGLRKSTLLAKACILYELQLVESRAL